MEDGAFAQGDGAVLGRVAEATVAEPEELRCDGGRGFVPLHAAINGGVGFAGFFLMAVGDESARPVAPGAAGGRGADAAEVDGRDAAGAVQRVGMTFVTGGEAGEAAQHVGDFPVFSRLVRGRDEFDGAKFRGDDDEAAAVLGDAVIGAIDDALAGIVGEVEAFLPEGVEEVGEDRVALQFRHIFHGDDVGTEFAHEPGEFVEQRPFFMGLGVLALGVFGERLAGGASHEDAAGALGIPLGEFLALQFGDALILEFGGFVVVLVGVLAGGVDVVAGGDFDAGVEQAAG